MLEFILVSFGLAFAALIVFGSILGLKNFFDSKKRDERIQALSLRLERMERVLQEQPRETLEKIVPVEKPAAFEEQAIPAKEKETDIPLEEIPVAKPVAPTVKPLPARKEEAGKSKEVWGDLEQKVGLHWMTWAGALILFMSAAFFVKYAFDNDWIGPTGRVMLGCLFGIVMLVSGDRFVRKEMKALGQGLIGAGLAVNYVALFVAVSHYEILPSYAAFGFMVAVTVLGMALAIVHDAVAISILAILGGLLTPVMASTGKDARDALFAYLLMLDFGVLGVAFYKKWRALDILAFLGTVSLFAGWYVEYYKSEALIPAGLWLTGFYIVFLILPFVFHLRTQTKINHERFILALANAGFYFLFAYDMMKPDYPHFLGFIALWMAVCYIVLGAIVRKRLPEDGRSLFGFIAMSIVFLTMAAPLQLKLNGITLAWAVEGPVLLYLGYRFKYLPVRIGGLAVLLLALIRLFDVHFPLHSDPYVMFLNTNFGSAFLVVIAFIAYGAIHHLFDEQSSKWDRYMKAASWILGGYLMVYLVVLEVSDWFVYEKAMATGNALTVLIWAAGAGIFLATSRKLKAYPLRIAGLGLLVVTVFDVLIQYFNRLPSPYMMFVNFRFPAAIIGALAPASYAWVMNNWKEPGKEEVEKPLKQALYWVMAFMLFYVFSYEAYSYFKVNIEDYSQGKWMALMSVSIVWALYAIVALIIGFWKRIKGLRIAALALLGLVAGKLILVDMAGVKQIYRIISFVVAGLMMIGASYLYHLVEKRLSSYSTEEKS